MDWIYGELIFGDHVLIEWAENDEDIVAALSEDADDALEGAPLQRNIWRRPISEWVGSAPSSFHALWRGLAGPRSGSTAGSAGRSPKSGAKGLRHRVGIFRRLIAIVFQRPLRNAMLMIIGDLQSGRPTRRSRCSFRAPRSFVRTRWRPIARNANRELRYESRVVEGFFFVGAQIRFRAGEPERIALDDDAPIAQ